MSTKEVLDAVQETLQTAAYGLELMERDPKRFKIGLRNLAVFGRAVTFALQNLRSKDCNFDEWYTPRQEMMRNDPVMKFFIELRNSIEKQARPLQQA